MDVFDYISVNSILAAVLVVLIVVYLISSRSKAKWPPGPAGYPVLGNLPQIDFKEGMYVTFDKWRQKYGDIYKIRLAGTPIVILSGYDMIHDAFVTQGEVFMDRPALFLPQSIFKGKGIIFQPFGPLWKEIRRLAVTTMRDLGVGKSSLEEKIVDEVNAIQVEILKCKEKPFEIRRLIQNAMANVICSINFGNRFEYDDPKFQRLLDLLNEFFASNPIANPVNFFPWLRFIPGLYGKLMRVTYCLNETRKLVGAEVEQHRATIDPNNIRDFVDVYLKAEHDQLKGSGISSNVSLDDQLFQTIHDLFNAGSETAATSISWILLYLIRNPDAQSKCHEELDRVVGQSRICSLKDKPNLPYIEACILETQRMSNIAPLAGVHATVRDVNYRGYFFPKGTMILASIWSVHHDKKYWPDPYSWKPERWLDDDGNIIRHEAFMPFSTGYRSCAGQQLAQMEMFIILTCLLQHFQFTSVPGQPMPSDHGVAGITRRPDAYQLCAIKR